jgi:type I restriction enzyme, S subunit
VFRWNGPEALVNQHIFKVEPDLSRVDLDYLRHAINASIHEMERFTHGSTMKHINRREFLDHRIPLPRLDEQRRIAAILDKADALRRKRKRALDLLSLLKEEFYWERFVQAQHSSWSDVSVEEVACDIRTGPFGSQLLHSEFVELGIPVLGIDNVVSNEFRWAERRHVTEQKFKDLKRYTVRPGDVLITIMGTCGRCAVVPDDIPTAINTKHLCCITLDTGRCLPEFMQATFLGHPSVLRQLGFQAKGAVMPGLNMGIIKSLRFALPPIPRQKEFVHAVRRLQEISICMRQNAKRSAALFSSLQHRAFSAQL